MEEFPAGRPTVACRGGRGGTARDALGWGSGVARGGGGCTKIKQKGEHKRKWGVRGGGAKTQESWSGAEGKWPLKPYRVFLAKLRVTDL